MQCTACYVGSSKIINTQHFKSKTNKAVIDSRFHPRCCQLESYFKYTSFSCHYICKDILCKHDIINIQHAYCSLVGPDCKKESRASAACNEYSYMPSPRLRVSLTASVAHSQPGGNVKQPPRVKI